MSKLTFFKTYSSVAALIMAMVLTGCLIPDEGSESGTTVVTEPTDIPPALTTPERTVCDPFNTNSPQARDRGLAGQIFYLTDDMPRYGNIADFMNNAVVIEALLYLDRLFIPTRPFDRGFYTAEGSLVTNANGDPIYEYFGVRMESQLQLGANEPAGYYQLATLADDGALWKLKDQDGVESIVVNNDGTHATKMACSTTPVWLDHNSKIPMVMEYYQGPRYHISLVAMWRPWPDGVEVPVNDPLCGSQGNSLFFDSTKNPVEAKTAFYELLERNWKVLENQNYYFPEQASNPCAVASEETLVVTDFQISNVARNQVTVTWKTNIPAKSQAQVKNVSTGALITSTLSETLVTNHSAVVTGLTANTLYSVKAISTTPGGQTANSDERAFRTLR